MQSNFDEVGIYNVIAVNDFVHLAGVKGESVLSFIFNLIIKWEYRSM